MYNEYEAPLNPAGEAIAQAPTTGHSFKRISLGLILWLAVGGSVFSLIGNLPSWLVMLSGPEAGLSFIALSLLGSLLSFLGGCAYIVGVVFFYIALYKTWALLAANGTVSTTPGKAVGFIFIPGFALYWNFVAHYKLSLHFNALVRDRKYPVKPLSEKLFFARALLPAVLVVGVIVLIVVMIGGVVNLIAMGQSLPTDNFPAMMVAILSHLAPALVVLALVCLLNLADSIIAIVTIVQMVNGYNQLGPLLAQSAAQAQLADPQA